MSNLGTSYFFKALLVMVGAALIFWLAKPYLPQQLFTVETTAEEIAVDTLLLEAIKENQITENAIDTANAKQTVIPTKKLPDLPSINGVDLIQFSDFDLDRVPVADSTSLPPRVALDSYSGVSALGSFFDKLDSLQAKGSGHIRVAYYGDSMIEADLIVQKFRELFQTSYGGRGVGLVPIADVSSRARYSVKHRHNGWTTQTFMRGDPPPSAYGINGGIYTVTDSSATLKFKNGGIKHTFRLYNPRLIYGASQVGDSLEIMSEGDTLSRKRLLNSQAPLNFTELSSGNPKTLDLRIISGNPSDSIQTPYYAMDFSQGTGVHVDNFAMRGNSGLPLSSLSSSLMRKFQDELDYDLIVLQFGANVLSTKAKNFNWYASRMTRVVRHLQNCFPEVPILVIGTADKSTKIDGRMKTDSTVIKLLHAQQKFAAQTESGFISLLHLMGGINSMPSWAEHSPKLAVGDYTHFSPRGAQKIGARLFYELERYHQKYRERPKQAVTKAADSLTLNQSQDTLNQ